MRKVLLLLLIALTACITASAKKTIPVFITAGQSNTDGRILNNYLPDYIKQNKYKHCYWSYNSGSHSADGKFELFRHASSTRTSRAAGLTMLSYTTGWSSR